MNRSTDRGGMGPDCPSLEPERGLLKVLNVTWMNATIFKCRPFNETRAIAHECAGMRLAQMTRSVYRARQLYQKYTWKHSQSNL